MTITHPPSAIVSLALLFAIYFTSFDASERWEKEVVEEEE